VRAVRAKSVCGNVHSGEHGERRTHRDICRRAGVIERGNGANVLHYNVWCCRTMLSRNSEPTADTWRFRL
jgi:hypothetical protein